MSKLPSREVMTISQLCSSDDFFPSVERLFCFIFTARRPVAAGVIYGLPLAAKFGTDSFVRNPAKKNGVFSYDPGQLVPEFRST